MKIKNCAHLYQTRLDSAAAWQWRIDRDDDAFHETYAAIKTELQQDRPVIIELRWVMVCQFPTKRSYGPVYAAI